MQDKTQLYRYYNLNRELLYVGISLNAMQRLMQHRDSKSWFDEISFISIQQCDSRKEALKLEKQAIEQEKPIHNRQHNHALPHQRGQKQDDNLISTSIKAEIEFIERQRDKLQILYLAAEQSNLEWRNKFQSLLITNNALSKEIDNFQKSKNGRKYLKKKAKNGL
jgi:predicted GIY-YIG superfamily endonuclease